VAPLLLCCATAHAAAYFENGDFKHPQPEHGSFVILDSGERFGSWRVAGAAGNVAWVSGAYQHDGFSFFAPGRPPDNTDDSWVNLAGISQTATGIIHGPVPTKPGHTYRLTFWVGNIYDTVGLYGTTSTVAAYENATLVGVATNSGGAGTNAEYWQQFTYDFVAEAPWTVIGFMNMDGPGDLNCGVGNIVLAPAGQAAAEKGGK